MPYLPACLRALNYCGLTCLKLLCLYVLTRLRAYIYSWYLRAFVSWIISSLRAAIFHVFTCLEPFIFTRCNKASSQLNAIGRIQKYVGFKEKEVLLNSFASSNFNHCPLVWHFYSSKSYIKSKKYKNGHLTHFSPVSHFYTPWKRQKTKGYRNVTLDYYYTTTSLLIMLKKSGKVTMEIKLQQCLELKIFKTVTLNNLIPCYMKEFFSKTTNLTHIHLDVNFNQNTTKYRYIAFGV